MFVLFLLSGKYLAEEGKPEDQTSKIVDLHTAYQAS